MDVQRKVGLRIAGGAETPHGIRGSVPNFRIDHSEVGLEVSTTHSSVLFGWPIAGSEEPPT
jgi:hypothetical protein